MDYPLDLRTFVDLNGTRQRVHLLARRPGLPGLLVLHGGPGLPNRHILTGRLRGLAEYFFLILWDQRGTGGSAQPRGAAPVTLDQIVEDAARLTTGVRGRFGLDEVNVLGFSWGTELGIRLIQRYPDRYRAYVGSGQAVDGVRNEEIGYRLALDAAKAAGDLDGIRTLERVGPPVNGQYRPVVKGLIAQRRIAARHHPLRSKKGYLTGLLSSSLLSPEYTMGDRIGIARGATRSLAELWPSITGYDFTADARELPVPVTFLQGRHDWTTPSELVEEYAGVVRAPSVRLTWFEESGHSVTSAEPLKFQRELLAALSS